MKEKPIKDLTYAKAGVDIDKGRDFIDKIKNYSKATARPGATGDLGGFGGIFDLKKLNYKDPLLIAANDGVGTKLKIAIDSNDHSTIGIDLVAMCVNDLITHGAEPLFFLDYLASASLDLEQACAIVKGISFACKEAGCALIGGETAEMPGLYRGGDYDLAGFAVGAVERDKLLPKKDMQEGDIILALPSSGVHSNGFSLIRKLISAKSLKLQDKAPFCPEQSLASALLTPTKLYVKTILNLLEACFPIKALAHITGGGLPENLPRVLTDDLCANIDLNRLKAPPVFTWLAQIGQISEAEMLKVFNCGVGMVMIIAAPAYEDICAKLAQMGETPIKLGQLSKRHSKAISFSGQINYQAY